MSILPQTLWRGDSQRKGLFIAICGFDGSGKSTQVNLLEQHLANSGREVIVTREPTDWYRQDKVVRHVLAAGGSVDEMRLLALLSAADRQRHVLEIIDPALTRGAVVICDRYVYSAVALFQARGLDREFVTAINSPIPRPDLAVFLDVPPEILLDRIQRRGLEERKFEERSVANVAQILTFYQAMRSDFLWLAGNNTEESIAQSISGAVHEITQTLEAKWL